MKGLIVFAFLSCCSGAVPAQAGGMSIDIYDDSPDLFVHDDSIYENGSFRHEYRRGDNETTRIDNGRVTTCTKVGTMKTCW